MAYEEFLKILNSNNLLEYLLKVGKKYLGIPLKILLINMYFNYLFQSIKH
jgi:hypothetical protein